MDIHRLNPLCDPRWTEFVHQSPRASVFHTRDWLYSIHRTYGYEPVVLTTSPPTTELRNGLVFCRIRSWLTGSRMVSLPFSDHCEPLIDSDEEFALLISCLQAEMKHQGCSHLEIRPIDRRFENNEPKGGFSRGNSYYLHRLDIRPPLDEIFRSLDRNSAQRRIQRAKRAGIDCRTGRSEELLQDFYKLLIHTRRRHGLPPQPYRWFQNLVDCMGKALEIRVAYKGYLPIAAILTLQFRKSVYYKYGCSDARFHGLGAMPALLWRALDESKAAGSEEFDLGRSECQNKGLIAFKNHWVRKPERLVYWRYPASTAAPSTEGWKLKIVKRAFACMPNGLLAITGRLMYRHIG